MQDLFKFFENKLFEKNNENKSNFFSSNNKFNCSYTINEGAEFIFERNIKYTS